MKRIGGFFELELPKDKKAYHANAIGLTSGRACLSLILKETKPDKVYIPFYCCDSFLSPIKEQGIAYEFYSIGLDLMPLSLPKLQKNEKLIWINYFGLLDPPFLGENIIIDNTQAFFAKDYTGTWSFNSARKFFGVPDGAFLYAPCKIETEFPDNPNIALDHLLLRFEGRHTEAYDAYVKAEEKITNEIFSMSQLSKALLGMSDMEKIRKIRRSNFQTYHDAFKSVNQIPVQLKDDAIPFCYPLLLSNPLDKEQFFKNDIFIPTFWKERAMSSIQGFSFEKKLSNQLLPLPLDHRHTEEDCSRVIDAIRMQLCS